MVQFVCKYSKLSITIRDSSFFCICFSQIEYKLRPSDWCWNYKSTITLSNWRRYTNNSSSLIIFEFPIIFGVHSHIQIRMTFFQKKKSFAQSSPFGDANILNPNEWKTKWRHSYSNICYRCGKEWESLLIEWNCLPLDKFTAALTRLSSHSVIINWTRRKKCKNICIEHKFSINIWFKFHSIWSVHRRWWCCDCCRHRVQTIETLSHLYNEAIRRQHHLEAREWIKQAKTKKKKNKIIL